MATTLDHQPVRAEILIGDLGIIRTPDIVSFSVRRARNQMCATFQASVKVDANELSSFKEIISTEIIIKAGLKNRLKTVFTGKIYNCVINPVRTNASKIMLNLTGKDVLCRLEGQKVNRRLKTYRDGDKPPERTGYITTVLRKNVPIRQKFKTNLFTEDPVVIDRIPRERIIQTESAYRGAVQEMDRNVPKGAVGEIIHTTVETGGETAGG